MALITPMIVVVLNSEFSETVLVKLGVSIFSGIAAVASGMLGTVKFEEYWTRYRYNCEMLKVEVAAYINERVNSHKMISTHWTSDFQISGSAIS